MNVLSWYAGEIFLGIVFLLAFWLLINAASEKRYVA
jgi:hypothetical protein